MAITTTKARLNLSIDSELKQEVGEVLKEIGLDYTTAINLYFNKIRRDRKIPFELEARKNLTVDEFLGSNWREGLENVEDGWDWVIKLNWYLKRKMIFINYIIVNVFMLKSHLSS